MLHRLRVAHPERRRSLELASVDGLDTCAEYLGQVCRAVQREHQNTRDEVGRTDTRDSQSDERDEYLKKERRASNDIDVHRSEPTE